MKTQAKKIRKFIHPEYGQFTIGQFSLSVMIFFQTFFCTLSLIFVSIISYSQIINKQSPSSILFVSPTTKTELEVNYQLQPSMPIGGTAQDIEGMMKQTMIRGPVYTPGMTPQERQQVNIQNGLVKDPAYAPPGKMLYQNKKEKQIHDLKILLSQEMETLPKISPLTKERNQKTIHYKTAFDEIMRLYDSNEKDALKQVIFLIENAYSDNNLSYVLYNKGINQKVQLLRNLMKKERISDDDMLGKNYLIQKLFSENVTDYDQKSGTIKHNRYQYDFNDFFGETNWSNMFVTKLLETGKGQCHSMPLLYLIFAQEIDTKAWLSLAPQHSYIKFPDNTGRNILNFETTQGSSVTNDWLMESGYINSMAVRNEIYLDTLGKNELYSTLLADLALGYANKFGYDAFFESIVDAVLNLNPKSIQGLMLKSDLLIPLVNTELKKAGNPPIEEIQKYPSADKYYSLLMKLYDAIDNLGYQNMPKERYEAWLTSLNTHLNGIK
jgi:hypothetical protein